MRSLSSYDKIFLDFDRTIFDGAKFREWLDEYFHLNHGMDKGHFRSTIDLYTTGPTDLERVYDQYAHHRDVAGVEWEKVSGDMERAIYDQDITFLYDDGEVFLRKLLDQHADVRLLTFGDPAFQLYKIRLCHLLAELKIPVHVTRSRKSDFLKQYHSAHITTLGVLLDDKYPLDLPDNWDHICVDRDQRHQHTDHKRLQFVKSLEEIEI
jgi:hypothetical protein